MVSVLDPGGTRLEYYSFAGFSCFLARALTSRKSVILPHSSALRICITLTKSRIPTMSIYSQISRFQRILWWWSDIVYVSHAALLANRKKKKKKKKNSKWISGTRTLEHGIHLIVGSGIWYSTSESRIEKEEFGIPPRNRESKKRNSVFHLGIANRKRGIPNSALPRFESGLAGYGFEYQITTFFPLFFFCSCTGQRNT